MLHIDTITNHIPYAIELVFLQGQTATDVADEELLKILEELKEEQKSVRRNGWMN